MSVKKNISRIIKFFFFASHVLSKKINMRSIRMRLLASIGSLFLLIAILSYFITHFFVSKDIDGASAYLSSIYTQYQNRLKQLSGSWVTYRFVNEAAKLSIASQTVIVADKPLWALAASVVGQDPSIALVQVTDKNQETAVIAPESGQTYIPRWAKDSEGRLWIEIPEKEKLFLARPIKRDKVTYLLHGNQEDEKEARSLSFTPFENPPKPQPSESDTTKIYAAVRAKENNLLEKSKMIQQLADYEGHADGILRTDLLFKKGKALLVDEIFFKKPVVSTAQPGLTPFILYRSEGPYVDLMQFATRAAPFIIVGYSLSSIAGEIARTVRKPVIIYNKGAPLQAFSQTGVTVPINSFTKNDDKILFDQELYIPNEIAIGPLTFTLLIPESEKSAIQKVLHQIRNSLITKISSNLLILAIALFLLSMFVLLRISKRFTKPITQLALASEEIGKGKYEGLGLPPVEKRHDEVAILSHSFQKMVASLRDRERIRGVLNKVVSKEIATTILNSNIELGGEQRVLTMLFSDIRGFTPLSEQLEPQVLIRLLNTYMTRMCRIIDETHGVVDKFVGDEIMALYGTPLPLIHHAEKAIEAALLMIEDLLRWNQERGEKEPQITVGIGIHTGAAFAGNMGAEDRLNYTVVGANVNLAARLCSAAKPMQILVSEYTYRVLTHPEKFNFRKLEPILLKGIDTPVSIYEVIN